MTEITKINKILKLIFSDTGKGYCEWENKLISVEEANGKVISLIKNLNSHILNHEENHEIMITIENNRVKTLEEMNIIRWWGESMDFPKFADNTKIPTRDIFELHTKVVFPQTISLVITLMIVRLNQSKCLKKS
jgi:hypothetical protein